MDIPCRRILHLGVGRYNSLYATTRLLGAEVSSQTLIRLETGGENIGNRPTGLQVATVARLNPSEMLVYPAVSSTAISDVPKRCWGIGYGKGDHSSKRFQRIIKS